uniref:Rhodanese domain-containing protein n=1 Tax=Macrostomum lignano TaxID=282301 RepID=A0A1I8F911_9PLAT
VEDRVKPYERCCAPVGPWWTFWEAVHAQELARSAPRAGRQRADGREPLTSAAFDQLFGRYTDRELNESFSALEVTSSSSKRVAKRAHRKPFIFMKYIMNSRRTRPPFTPAECLGDQQREGLRAKLRLAVPGRATDRLLAASKAAPGLRPGLLRGAAKWLSCGPSCRRWSRERWTGPAAAALMALMAPPPSSSGSAPSSSCTTRLLSAAARLPHSPRRRGGLRRGCQLRRRLRRRETPSKTTTTATTSTLSKKSSRKTAAKKKSKEPNLLTLTQMIRPASDVDDQPQQQGDDVEAVEKESTQHHVGNCGRVRIEAAITRRRGCSASPDCRHAMFAVRRQAWWQRRVGAARRQDSSCGHQQGRCRCFWTAGGRTGSGCTYDPDSTPRQAAGGAQPVPQQRAGAAAPLVVYFFVVEEQRYLTQLRKEKEAFEFSHSVGRGDERAGLSRATWRQWRTGGNPTMRIAAAAAEQHQVIVDVREFRSELPCLLHRRGITILPAVRLLLIEFDAVMRTGFALYHGRAAMSSDLNSSDTISRLSLAHPATSPSPRIP